MTLSLTANRLIEFGSGQNGQAALLLGWGSAERGQVWSEGPEAVLRFSLPQLQPGSEFVIKASPHLVNGLGAQRLAIYGNGLHIGTKLLRDDGEISFLVPSFVCMSVIVSGLLDLAFDIPDCRPGSGADRRLLGFALHSVNLRAP